MSTLKTYNLDTGDTTSLSIKTNGATAVTIDSSKNVTMTGGGQIRGTATGVPPLLADSAGNSATCRAWVNFNGTGTIAIRASFNVTSITDNGVGDYTVNFTNALPDANFSVCSMNVGWNTVGSHAIQAYGPLTTTSVRVYEGIQNVGATSTAYQDVSTCSVTVFR